MNRTQRITNALNKNLSPSYLKLSDQSSLHAEHIEGGTGSETHYQLVIEAPCFSGMTKVKRHQAIYALLADEFETGLHALAIQAYAPGERKSA